MSGNILFEFLSLNKPVEKPHILLVEGYLSDNVLKEASELFNNGSYQYIITTGLNAVHYYRIGSNGDLVLKIKKFNVQPGSHILSFKAFNTQSNEVSAHVETWIDTIKIGNSVISTVPKDYNFTFRTDSIVDSITIRLLNVALYKNQDIDFYISTVTIDSVVFSVNDTSNYFKAKHKPNWKNFLAPDHAIRTKYVLLQYNVPESKIIPISTIFDVRSRTAETAMNTLNTLDSIFNTDTIRLNIFTRKPHTLRTYLAYNKYIENNLKVGIIPSNCYISKKSRGRLKNLRELVGIICLWLIY